MEQNNEKKSIFQKIQRIISLTLYFLFPSVKLLAMNKRLKKADDILENKEGWFKRQIRKNYILSIVFLIPLAILPYKAYVHLDNDLNFHKRIYQASQTQDIIPKIENYYYSIFEKETDSKELKQAKFETQARFFASFIVLFISLTIQLLITVLVFVFHPIYVMTENLKDGLIENAGFKKEKILQNPVLATPMGCLINVEGRKPQELIANTGLWNTLNIKVRNEFYQDEEKNSLVFFPKTFELKNKYIYDQI